VTAADARDLADAIILLLKEADVRASMERRAFQFGTTFSWPRVFEKALNETFEAQSA
jgi:glycosyltransferase involved in cell wall biosynthesis